MSEDCHQEHEELKVHLLQIEQTLEYHVAEAHEALRATDVTHKEESVVADLEIHRQLDEMAEVVLGVPHQHIDGMVTRSGGMAAMVEANENGGLRFKWANLIIGSLVVVLVALIGLYSTVISHQSESNATDQQVVTQVEDNTDRLTQILIELEQLEPGD